ncbi:Ig-like domain repeat protein [Corynebacterium rouxii]|uniref:Ig-like domain-containing protein n=1 Tax=Corynebacterium rouxii TaxID=2719119 RepID=UPI003CF0018D
MKLLRTTLAGITALTITLSGTNIARADESLKSDTLTTPISASKKFNASVSCSVSSLAGTTTQESNFEADFDTPDSIKVGESFTATVKIKDISVENDNLSRFSSASLSSSRIRLNVGKNVQLDGIQPGVSISNGILSIDNKLRASLKGKALNITADPIQVRLKVISEGDIVITPEETILTTTAKVSIFTATAACKTNKKEPFTTIKVEPAEGLTLNGPVDAVINQDVQFTATAPVSAHGRVQFFVDHIAYGDAIQLSENNKASTTVRFDSSGSKIVTARYIDTEGYNPIPDGETSLSVVNQLATKKAEDEDTYTGLINGSAASLTAPAKVKPGEKVSVTTSLLPTKTPIRVYEIGINAPEGVKYIEDSGKTEYSSKLATKGATFTSPGSGYYDPQWNSESHKPNESYRGFHSDTSYSVVDTSPQTVSAEFEIPKTLAPGIYMFQMGVYKYTTGFKDLVNIPETAFEIAGPELPELPPRNIKPAAQEEPENTDNPSSNSIIKSPWFWTGIIGAVAGIAALVYKFFFAPR